MQLERQIFVGGGGGRHRGMQRKQRRRPATAVDDRSELVAAVSMPVWRSSLTSPRLGSGRPGIATVAPSARDAGSRWIDSEQTILGGASETRQKKNKGEECGGRVKERADREKGGRRAKAREMQENQELKAKVRRNCCWMRRIRREESEGDGRTDKKNNGRSERRKC